MFLKLFCFIFGFSFMSSAVGNPSEKPGVNANISLIAGAITSNSNLSSENHFKLDLLNTRGEKKTSAIYGALIDVNYITGSHKFFLGTSRDDIAIGIIAAEIGYRYTFPTKLQLSFSYLPSLIDQTVWADPFILNQQKTETEKKGHAYRVKLQNLATLPLSLDLAFASSDVVVESSGTSQGLQPSEVQQLARDCDIYFSKLSYSQFLGPGFGITPSLIFNQNRAKGDALKYNRLGIGLSVFNFVGRSKFVFSFNYEKDNYEASHPVFNTKREDRAYGSFLAYEYNNILSVPHLSAIALVGYDKLNSNISFYSETQSMLSFGLKYAF